jgi:hypothetical protein
VVYPPGIATIVPGERLDERAQPMIDYLKVFERGSNLFPGFESEIQGVYREETAGRIDTDLYLRDTVELAQSAPIISGRASRCGHCAGLSRVERGVVTRR